MNMLLILLVTILGVNAGPYLDQCKRNEDCKSDEECVLYSHDCFGQGASGLWAGQSARFSPCR